MRTNKRGERMGLELTARRYTRFYVQGLHGYLDVHVEALALVRCNLELQHLTWEEVMA